MLWTLVGKTKDLNARISRGNQAWFKVKKSQWKSDLTIRTSALAVQATVESKLLFECTVQPWCNSYIDKLQKVVYKAYRWIWNDGKGLARLGIQKEHVNPYRFSKQLQITSLRSKIELRTRERIGHIIRMPDCRAVKKAVLGNGVQTPKANGNLRSGTISYWCRILFDAGIDWTNVENLARNRKTWKQTLRLRERFLMDWEDLMSERRTTETMPTSSQQDKHEERQWNQLVLVGRLW